MPNYKQTDVSGVKWQRAVRVVIENPYNGVPSINFVEEQAVQLDDGIITTPVGNCTCSFDPEIPEHMALLTQRTAMYMLLTSKRDEVVEEKIEEVVKLDAKEEPLLEQDGTDIKGEITWQSF